MINWEFWNNFPKLAKVLSLILDYIDRYLENKVCKIKCGINVNAKRFSVGSIFFPLSLYSGRVIHVRDNVNTNHSSKINKKYVVDSIRLTCLPLTDRKNCAQHMLNRPHYVQCVPIFINFSFKSQYTLYEGLQGLNWYYCLV